MPKVKSSAGGTTPGAAGINGAAIASDALTYVGKARYVFGGAPGTKPGVDAGTDCSGFVNMVLGRDLGIAIPGYAAGAYTGSQHGQPVASYVGWSGATTLGKNEKPQAGDLVCYAPDTHIGIATSATDFVSALNPSLGVTVTDIKGAASGTIVYRRINGTGTAPTGSGGTSTTGSLTSGLGSALGSLGLGVGVVGGLLVVIIGGAAVLGMLGAALLIAAARRAGIPGVA